MAIDRAKKPEEVDVEEVLAELEHKVERVKILYEQYFMGIEKLEPQTARKEIGRKLLEIAQMNIRNTALRYRFNALQQKFGVYTAYWGRTLRAIENGTYFRSIARAGREAGRRGVDMPEEVLHALPQRLRERILKDRERLAASAERQAVAAASGAPAAASASAVPVSDSPMPLSPDGEEFDQTFDRLFDSMSGAPRTPDAPARSRAASPRPSGASPGGLPPGMDEAKMRDLYTRYTQARRALGEQSELRYEQLLATVQKTAPKILEQHKAREVEFSVVVRDGKVILKATPRK